MGTIKTTNIETITGSGTLTLGQSGETITIPSGATLDLSNATQTGVGGKNTPAFLASLSANQTISNVTWTKVQFNNEVYDTNSAYDNTSNYRFTVPTGQSGKYAINLTIRTNGQLENELRQSFGAIRKNGSAIAESAFINNNSYSYMQYVSVNVVLDLTAGDYLEGFAYIFDGDGTCRVEGAADYKSWFNGFKIIE